MPAPTKEDIENVNGVIREHFGLASKMTLTPGQRDRLAQLLADERERGEEEYWRLQKEVRAGSLFSVGWHKGEMDFSVSCAISGLTFKEMENLRSMTMVGIGQMERMWRDGNASACGETPKTQAALADGVDLSPKAG
ncbi:MAG: hypothetical protein M0R06_25060 [Sphaerochaeta sp.]|jgi:hypothetical protein|nr:hypothetical protein [Sphaerochaeta sp.]